MKYSNQGHYSMQRKYVFLEKSIFEQSITEFYYSLIDSMNVIRMEIFRKIVEEYVNVE